MRLLLAGLYTEGPTDNRFLTSVVKRTLDAIIFECKGQIETELEPILIEKSGKGFVEQVLEVSQIALDTYGMRLLFVHTDADNDLERIVRTKIEPAWNEIEVQSEEDFCKTLIAIIPVQMIEAWMLADKILLKEEIGTNKSDQELGLNKAPESIADPKEAIANAIRIAKQNETRRKRRRGLKISDLYQIVGQKVSLEKLRELPSYVAFEEGLRNALREINFLT